MGIYIELNRQISGGGKMKNYMVDMSSLSLGLTPFALYFVIIPKLFIEKCKNINYSFCILKTEEYF